jgi:endonuclease/exonuclease/phosphatase family metal-dependent hydrolase
MKISRNNIPLIRSIVFLTLILSFIVHLRAGESVRIASYNLRNYLISDRLVEGTWLKAYPKPEVEKSIIQEGLLAVKPDILVVQEIGGMSFLFELKEDLKALGLDYPFAILMEGEDSERMTGLLSRIKPDYSVQHKDLEFKYFDEKRAVLRGMLEVGFKGEISFSIFSVHLKSRYTSDRRDVESVRYRTSEAQACRDRILKRKDANKFLHYVICGDFNDGPNSAPLRRFYKKGSRIIGHQIFPMDRYGNHWTHFYAKEKAYTTVDGFVVSPSLENRVVKDSERIWDTDDYYTGSDHRLVYFDLAISK